MLKKAMVAAMGFAVSGLVSAGTMGALCVPGHVTVPCETKNWDLGVQALYLQSVYSSSKAYHQTQSPTNGILGLNNQWDWGYRLEGAYYFNTGNDLTIDWIHYSGGASQSNLAGPMQPQVGGMNLDQPFNLVDKNSLDQVYFSVGQKAYVGLIDKMRFFGGLQYAHLQTNTTHYFSTVINNEDLPFTSVSQFDNTDFKGLGPIIGVDYAYDLSSALSLTAHSAGSILYGTSRYSNGYVGTPIGMVVASVYGNTRTMVPSLDTKFGMNYAYSLAQGMLNFEGGYQAVNYFNVLQTQSIAGLSGPILVSDYGLYGPYFGFKYVGNA